MWSAKKYKGLAGRGGRLSLVSNGDNQIADADVLIVLAGYVILSTYHPRVVRALKDSEEC